MSKPAASGLAPHGERTVRIARYPFETASNPYQTILYRTLEREGVILVPDRPFTATALIRMRPHVRVLHFNWRLDRLYGSRATRPRVLLAHARLRFAKLIGYRIFWTIHDLASRERPGRREPMTDALSRRADTLFCHDESLAQRAGLELGIDCARIDVVPHGPLGSEYPAPRATRAETRASLGLADDEVVFLVFGNLRGYKEIDLVLEGFRRVKGPGARLVVAGNPEVAEVVAEVRVAASKDPRVVLLDRRIPDFDVAALFAACDVAVFGRRDGWTSGALVLALNLGLPAVVADCPAYVRLICDGRAGWAFDRDGGPDALAASLCEALSAPGASRAQAGALAASSSATLTWEEAAARMARRFRSTAEVPRRVLLEPGPADG